MRIIGIILVIISLVIRYWLGKKNFERRNAFGVQEFKSYRHALMTRLGENFIHFIFYFLFVTGCFFIIASFA